jgi:hypothetical protein
LLNLQDMKTTLDIPEALLRLVKARAALRGGSMRDFFIDAVVEKLGAEGSKSAGARGWRTVFGKAPKDAAGEVQAILDGEFQTVDPQDWR